MSSEITNDQNHDYNFFGNFCRDSIKTSTFSGFSPIHVKQQQQLKRYLRDHNLSYSIAKALR